MSFNSSEV